MAPMLPGIWTWSDSRYAAATATIAPSAKMNRGGSTAVPTASGGLIAFNHRLPVFSPGFSAVASVPAHSPARSGPQGLSIRGGIYSEANQGADQLFSTQKRGLVRNQIVRRRKLSSHPSGTRRACLIKQVLTTRVWVQEQR
jgi:hypothetical protein